MSNLQNTLRDFLKAKNYFPKVRFEPGKERVLVIGKVAQEEYEDEIRLNFVVRDRGDGEVKSWKTRALSAINTLLELGVSEGSVVGVKMSTKSVAGKPIKVYDIRLIESSSTTDVPTEEEELVAAEEVDSEEEVDLSDIDFSHVD